MAQKTTQKQKKKLCWNCEGNVNFKDENCPFCGVYLSPINIGGDTSASDLLNPPYQMDKVEEQEVPDAPYADAQAGASAPLLKNVAEAEKQSGEFRDQVITITLLLSGCLFFIFAFVLFLFSNNGVFTLRWNGDFWFVYLALALPMLLVGWLRLQKM